VNLRNSERSRCNEEIRLDALANAAYDYRFLLSRGYSSSILDIVAKHYMLDRYEKMLLFRCVHSLSYVYDTMKKLVVPCVNSLNSSILVIDFFNIVLTVLSIIKSECVFLCDDCLVRDLRGAKIRGDEKALLANVYKIIMDVLSTYRNLFNEVVIIADKNVSHSLDYVKSFSNLLSNNVKNIKVSYILSQTPDSETISMAKHGVVASTDAVIIEKADKVLPLTTMVLWHIGLEPRIDFPKLFGYYCPFCFKKPKMP